LAAFGVTPEDFPVLVEKASVSSSMKGNPLKLTPEELQEILTRAM
jgi:alcohol dehydrogenase class IV